MQPAVEDNRNRSTRRHPNLWLWVAVLAAPVAWMLQLQIVYAMVQPACRSGRGMLLHAPTAVLLAVSVAAAWHAVRAWRSDGFTPVQESDPCLVGRRRFMAVVGVMGSALFFLVIIAQWIPVMFIDPCWG